MLGERRVEEISGYTEGCQKYQNDNNHPYGSRHLSVVESLHRSRERYGQ